MVAGLRLPVKPGWLVQEEDEERTNLAFQLERLTKEIRRGRTETENLS